MLDRDLERLELGETFCVTAELVERLFPPTGSDPVTRLALHRAGNRDDPPRSTEERLREFAHRYGCKVFLNPETGHYLIRKFEPRKREMLHSLWALDMTGRKHTVEITSITPWNKPVPAGEVRFITTDSRAYDIDDWVTPFVPPPLQIRRGYVAVISVDGDRREVWIDKEDLGDLRDFSRWLAEHVMADVLRTRAESHGSRATEGQIDSSEQAKNKKV